MEKNENGYPRGSARRSDVGGVTESGRNCQGNIVGGTNNNGSVGGVTDGCGPDGQNGTCIDSLDMKPLAYAYVPIQRWQMLYPVDRGLERGTLFEELDKPMEVYGNEW